MSRKEGSRGQRKGGIRLRKRDLSGGERKRKVKYEVGKRD